MNGVFVQALIDLRDDLGLNPANVVITGDCGSSLDSVALHAIRRFEQEPDFERVYCVFDRDQHEDYKKASDRIGTKTLRRRNGDPALFRAITSVPCFEYWLLLHSGYNTAPFYPTQSRSPCAPVIAALKQASIRDYEKAMRGVYERSKPRLQRAIQNAERALKAAVAAGTDNPTTCMHESVIETCRKARRKCFRQRCLDGFVQPCGAFC
ncbi:RloB family protein [Thiorhodococcus minor]|uniref:RloB domain-containing protein n=1 Tax=Thiorhodococcus minor TaxID=57489 RepID=A0A6M0K1J7_9GAMM|nr:RloB family protein [Thiorhodococcus minor]NEV63259.1 RloB domain-containing protein [Thiorhodococcus minor]